MERFFGIIMKKFITVFLLSLAYFSSNKTALLVFFRGGVAWFLFWFVWLGVVCLVFYF